MSFYSLGGKLWDWNHTAHEPDFLEISHIKNFMIRGRQLPPNGRLRSNFAVLAHNGVEVLLCILVAILFECCLRCGVVVNTIIFHALRRV